LQVNLGAFRLTIIKFKVLCGFDEYTSSNRGSDICSFIGFLISNDDFSTTTAETGNQSSSQEQIDVPLNFSLKVKGGGEDKNATEGAKDITVTLKLQSSEGGSPMDLPLKTKVSNDTKLQDIQLCGAMKEGKQMCQSLEKLSEKGQNQSSGGSSEESKASSNSTDKNNGNGDN